MTNDGANLYDLAQPRLARALGTIVSPPFRVKQIEEWMYVHGVDSFDAMTNIPKELRNALAEHYRLDFPQVIERTTPAKDGSQKYLFSLRDGNRIEAVYLITGRLCGGMHVLRDRFFRSGAQPDAGGDARPVLHHPA